MSERVNHQGKVDAEYLRQINNRADKIVAGWLAGKPQREVFASNPSGQFGARQDEAELVRAAILNEFNIQTQLIVEDHSSPFSGPWFTLVLVPSRTKPNADAFDIKQDKERLNLRQAAAFIKRRVGGDDSPCTMLRSSDNFATPPTWPPSEVEFAQDVAREMTLLGHPVEPRTEPMDGMWVLWLAPVA